MKTMKKDNDIVRVSDKDEVEFLKKGYSYIPKQEWKEKVRVKTESKKKEKQSDKKTRKSKKV